MVWYDIDNKDSNHYRNIGDRNKRIRYDEWWEYWKFNEGNIEYKRLNENNNYRSIGFKSNS